MDSISSSPRSLSSTSVDSEAPRAPTPKKEKYPLNKEQIARIIAGIRAMNSSFTSEYQFKGTINPTNTAYIDVKIRDKITKKLIGSTAIAKYGLGIPGMALTFRSD